MSNKRELITKHLEGWTGLRASSIENYNSSGRVSGGLLVAIEKMMDEHTNNALKLKDDEIKKLKQMLPKVCNHEFVSSVAYKGARVCTKCGVYK